MRLACFIALIAACSTAPNPTPCSAEGLQSAIDKAAPLAEGAKPSALLRGIAAACNDPSLPALLEGPPPLRASMLTGYVQEFPEVWNAGCPGGIDGLAGLAALPASRRIDKMFSVCRLDRFGWSLPRARIMGDRLPVGIIVAGRLSNSDPTKRQQILDQLAGR